MLRFLSFAASRFFFLNSVCALRVRTTADSCHATSLPILEKFSPDFFFFLVVPYSKAS